MNERKSTCHGVAFWLVSAVRGTAVLVAGTIVALWCTFSVAVIRSDGFSARAIVEVLPPALFWALAGVTLTGVVSIPAATVLTGVIRIGCERRRKRGVSGEAVHLFNRAGLFTLVRDPVKGLYDTVTSAPEGYAVGFHAVTGDRFFAIPAPPGNTADPWTRFAITDIEYAQLTADPAACVALAAECMSGDHDDRLIRVTD